MKVIACLALVVFITGCSVAFNKTIHTYDGKVTNCAIAISDEGGVCWHGSVCSPNIGSDPTECPSGGIK